MFPGTGRGGLTVPRIRGALFFGCPSIPLDLVFDVSKPASLFAWTRAGFFRAHVFPRPPESNGAERWSSMEGTLIAIRVGGPLPKSAVGGGGWLNCRTTGRQRRQFGVAGAGAACSAAAATEVLDGDAAAESWVGATVLGGAGGGGGVLGGRGAGRGGGGGGAGRGRRCWAKSRGGAAMEACFGRATNETGVTA